MKQPLQGLIEVVLPSSLKKKATFHHVVRATGSTQEAGAWSAL